MLVSWCLVLTTLSVNYYYYPHFIDENTEAQRGFFTAKTLNSNPAEFSLGTESFLDWNTFLKQTNKKDPSLPRWSGQRR